MTRLLATAATLCLALAAAGCGPSGPDLDGAWELERGVHEGRDVPIVAGSRITLTVDGDEVGGRSACNLYGGSLERDGARVRVGALTTTEMACAEPVMASEAAYVAALGAVETAARDGDRLTLAGPEVELVFRLLPPVPTAELVGTTWVLDTLVAGDTASSVAGGRATLLLADDGALSGSTGCRSFEGTYEVAGDEVKATRLAADDRACPDELAAQDAHVLAVLGDGFTAAVDGNRLVLSAGDAGLGYVAGGGGS